MGKLKTSIIMCGNCLCVFEYDVPQSCNITCAALVDRNLQHQVLEDDHTYSTVDGMQQRIFIDNPAYSNCGLEHSQQPAQCSDYGRSTIELSQDRQMEKCGHQAGGAVHFKMAASDK